MKQIYTGAEVKMTQLDEHTVKVSGLGVIFDEPGGKKDLVGEFFTKDTYFGHRKGDMSDALFNHGIPIIPQYVAEFVDADAMKVSRELSNMKFTNPIRTSVHKDGLGIVASLILNRRKKYENFVANLVQRKALSWSSGALTSAKKDYKTGEIKQWIIGEFSLTPTPAEPRATLDITKSVEQFDSSIVKLLLSEQVDVTNENENAVQKALYDYKWAKMMRARAKVLD